MSKCIDPRGCARFHWCHCLEGRGLPHSLCKTVGRFHRCTNSNHRFHNRLGHRETRKNFLGRTEISPKGTVCIGHDPFDLGTDQNHKSCIQTLRSRWRICQWRISICRARWYPVGKNDQEVCTTDIWIQRPSRLYRRTCPPHSPCRKLVPRHQCICPFRNRDRPRLRSIVVSLNHTFPRDKT